MPTLMGLPSPARFRWAQLLRWAACVVVLAMALPSQLAWACPEGADDGCCCQDDDAPTGDPALEREGCCDGCVVATGPQAQPIARAEDDRDPSSPGVEAPAIEREFAALDRPRQSVSWARGPPDPTARLYARVCSWLL